MSGARPVIWDIEGNELLELGTPGRRTWRGHRTA
jgi:hypothetical protein